MSRRLHKKFWLKQNGVNVAALRQIVARTSIDKWWAENGWNSNFDWTLPFKYISKHQYKLSCVISKCHNSRTKERKGRLPCCANKHLIRPCWKIYILHLYIVSKPLDSPCTTFFFFYRNLTKLRQITTKASCVNIHLYLKITAQWKENCICSKWNS